MLPQIAIHTSLVGALTYHGERMDLTYFANKAGMRVVTCKSRGRLGDLLAAARTDGGGTILVYGGDVTKDIVERYLFLSTEVVELTDSPYRCDVRYHVAHVHRYLPAKGIAEHAVKHWNTHTLIGAAPPGYGKTTLQSLFPSLRIFDPDSIVETKEEEDLRRVEDWSAYRLARHPRYLEAFYSSEWDIFMLWNAQETRELFDRLDFTAVVPYPDSELEAGTRLEMQRLCESQNNEYLSTSKKADGVILGRLDHIAELLLPGTCRPRVYYADKRREVARYHDCVTIAEPTRTHTILGRDMTPEVVSSLRAMTHCRATDHDRLLVGSCEYNYREEQRPLGTFKVVNGAPPPLKETNWRDPLIEVEGVWTSGRYGVTPARNGMARVKCLHRQSSPPSLIIRIQVHGVGLAADTWNADYWLRMFQSLNPSAWQEKLAVMRRYKGTLTGVYAKPSGHAYYAALAALETRGWVPLEQIAFMFTLSMEPGDSGEAADKGHVNNVGAGERRKGRTHGEHGYAVSIHTRDEILCGLDAALFHLGKQGMFSALLVDGAPGWNHMIEDLFH